MRSTNQLNSAFDSLLQMFKIPHTGWKTVGVPGGPSRTQLDHILWGHFDIQYQLPLFVYVEWL